MSDSSTGRFADGGPQGVGQGTNVEGTQHVSLEQPSRGGRSCTATPTRAVPPWSSGPSSSRPAGALAAAGCGSSSPAGLHPTPAGGTAVDSASSGPGVRSAATGILFPASVGCAARSLQPAIWSAGPSTIAWRFVELRAGAAKSAVVRACRSADFGSAWLRSRPLRRGPGLSWRS